MWSWDNNHFTQHEMVIPIMYRILQTYKGLPQKELLSGLIRLHNRRFEQL